jgi:acetyl-CoA/propionyl-CoA carboxylase biotin carboxyl carrier protein
MAGTLLRYVVEPGATVAADTTIALMESMKMETAILAGAAGTVSELLVAPGSAVKRGTLLARIES